MRTAQALLLTIMCLFFSSGLNTQAAQSRYLDWKNFTKHKFKDKQSLNLAIAHKNSGCKSILKKLEVTLALSEATRAFGLSNRTKPLAQDEGMLFIFEYPRIAAFWMKETLIPMQIGFIDEKGKISRIEKMDVERDPDHPKSLYKSPARTIAALEAAPHVLDNLLGEEICIELE